MTLLVGQISGIFTGSFVVEKYLEYQDLDFITSIQLMTEITR